MVSRIIISNKKNFNAENISFYKTLEEYCNVENDIDDIDGENNTCDYAESFDNMTTYFTDLGYWNSEFDLDKKKSSEVRENVLKSIQKLKDEGVEMAVWKENDDNDWWSGSVTPSKIGLKGFQNVDLPIEIRKTSLLFHLDTILKTTYDYDDTYIFYCE